MMEGPQHFGHTVAVDETCVMQRESGLSEKPKLTIGPDNFTVEF